MGYMGLDCWQDSDSAADSHSMVMDAIAKQLRKEMKDKGNCYNTDGPVNVALILEDMFINEGTVRSLYSDGDIIKLATDVRDIMATKLKECIDGDWDEHDMHKDAYNRMVCNLNKLLAAAY